MSQDFNNNSNFPKSLKMTEVKTRSNPIEKLLISIDSKKKEVRKIMAQKKLEQQANKLLQRKFDEMANKHKNDLVGYDEKFIEQIKSKDLLMDGPNLLEKFEMINNRIDTLKRKGLKIIVQHEESKKSTKKAKQKTGQPKEIKLKMRRLTKSTVEIPQFI